MPASETGRDPDEIVPFARGQCFSGCPVFLETGGHRRDRNRRFYALSFSGCRGRGGVYSIGEMYSISCMAAVV